MKLFYLCMLCLGCYMCAQGQNPPPVKATLVPPGNLNYAGLEKNVLFYANARYTVTQSGPALDLNRLFDGEYYPSYTATAPTEAVPTVVTIDGFPTLHTQMGTYVGWATRAWPATHFKIEAYQNETSAWISVVEVTNNTDRNFIYFLSNGTYSKLRYTFYTTSGTDGRLGVSELFYLHGEVGQAYDNIMVKYNADGKVGLGTATPDAYLHVVGKQGNSFGKFSQADVDDAEGYISIENGSAIPGNYIAQISGRSYAPGRPHGLVLMAKPEDVVSNSTDINNAGIVLDARSKTNATLTKSNILSVNNAGQSMLMVKANGNIGIGTVNPGDKLSVKGNVRAMKLIITNVGWSDYVFGKNYKLRPLFEVEKYIKQNQHLPDVPSAKEIAANGADIGDNQATLLRKIEELTLYLIEINKENELLKRRVEKLEKEK